MTRSAKLLLAIGIFGGSVWAVPITYTETVIGTGTWGTSVFTNALVTVTLIADTANVTSPSTGIFYSGPGSAAVEVAGLGAASFTDPDIEAYVYQGSTSGGITNFTIGGWPILATLNAGFATYDLKSSVGPLSGDAGKAPFINSTTLGDFRLTSVSGNATFTATTIPEPASTTLLSTGFLALLTGFRQRRIADC